MNYYPEFAKKLTHTKRYLRGGLLMVGVLGIGVVTWSLLFKIQNGIIATGVVTIEGETKTIQHLEGGSIEMVHVRDGDAVEIGDALVTLDTTVLTASKAQLRRQKLDLTGQIARLSAEKNNQSRITYSNGFLQNPNNPDIRSIVSNQDSIFEARRAAMGASQSQLNQRRLQYQSQQESLRQQGRAQQDQLRILENELGRLKRGLDLGVVAQVQFDAKERERITIAGQIASQQAELARLDNLINESYSGFELSLQEREERIFEELRDAESRLSDVTQKLEAVEYQLSNSVVKSPVSGLVHDLQLTTVNGVVKPGESLLKIVPDTNVFSVKASVRPTDIDQIFPGQQAMVRFSAFNQTTTPMLEGTVSYKSADHIVDKYTGESYFEIKVNVAPEEFTRLNGLTLHAGMPSEVYVQSEKRSIASYLVKPIKDAMTRIGQSE